MRPQVDMRSKVFFSYGIKEMPKCNAGRKDRVAVSKEPCNRRPFRAVRGALE